MPGFINPIHGLKNCPDLSFLDCFTYASEMDSTFPDFSQFTALAHFFASTPGFCDNSYNLSESQIASIHLYTQDSPFYSYINTLLRARDRKGLKPLFPLLKIILTALRSIPTQPKTVYRGVKKNLSAKFQKGKKFVWWSITSTTSMMDVLDNGIFLGATGERTLFAIETKSAVPIMKYAALGDEEDEWLIPPGLYPLFSLFSLFSCFLLFFFSSFLLFFFSSFLLFFFSSFLLFFFSSFLLFFFIFLFYFSSDLSQKFIFIFSKIRCLSRSYSHPPPRRFTINPTQRNRWSSSY